MEYDTEAKAMVRGELIQAATEIVTSGPQVDELFQAAKQFLINQFNEFSFSPYEEEEGR